MAVVFDRCCFMEGERGGGWDALGNTNVAGTASNLESGLMVGPGTGRWLRSCSEPGGVGQFLLG